MRRINARILSAPLPCRARLAGFATPALRRRTLSRRRSVRELRDPGRARRLHGRRSRRPSRPRPRTAARSWSPARASAAPTSNRRCRSPRSAPQELTDQGDVILGDALNELPSLRSTFSQANSTRFIGTAGLNLLDLRGLGTSRTLVLVNGRRHITGDARATIIVDVNTIPTRPASSGSTSSPAAIRRSTAPTPSPASSISSCAATSTASACAPRPASPRMATAAIISSALTAGRNFADGPRQYRDRPRIYQRRGALFQRPAQPHRRL